MRFRAGFTLVELVVVIAVIGLASVVAATASGEVRVAPLDATATDLRRHLSRARREALRNGRTVRVEVAPTGEGLVVRRSDNADSSVAADTIVVSSPIRIAGGEVHVWRFQPSGIAFADSLSLVGPSGMRTLHADLWTGDIRMDAGGR